MPTCGTTYIYSINKYSESPKPQILTKMNQNLINYELDLYCSHSKSQGRTEEAAETAGRACQFDIVQSFEC